MGRGLLLLALMYGYAGSSFDRYRPHVLDRPLQNYRRTVEQAVSDGRRALAMLDDARSMRYLERALRRLND